MPRPRSRERRQFGRRHARCHAFVKAPGRPLVPCVILNISEGGALLAFSGAPDHVPNTFLLRIDALGEERDCSVRHRHPRALGVLFSAPVVADAQIDTMPADRKLIWTIVQEYRSSLKSLPVD